MIVTFPNDVLERLTAIEENEGIPREELVQQAVAVWSLMTPQERLGMGLEAIRNALRRIRGHGDDA